MTTMTRALAKQISAELKKFAADLAAKYGMRLEVTNASFDDESFRTPIKMVTAGTPTKREKEEARTDYSMEALLLGVNPDCIGKTIKNGRGSFTIVGLYPNRPQYPVSIVDEKGQRRKTSIEWAIAHCGAYPYPEAPAKKPAAKPAKAAPTQNARARRPAEDAKPAGKVHNFKANQLVQAKWTDGEWYDAIVIEPRENGKAKVEFLDGDGIKVTACRPV